MKTATREAAERLRPIFGRPGGMTMEEQQTAGTWTAMSELVRAYLADHPTDDDDAAAMTYRILDDGHQTPWHDGTVIGAVAVIKAVAKRIGYAVAWHGSLCRDIDLVAVPWTQDAVEAEELVKQIMEAVGGVYTHGQINPSKNPHGRLSYAINLHPSAVYVDLSVMPIVK